jgi:hypothetical protein
VADVGCGALGDRTQLTAEGWQLQITDNRQLMTDN